MTKNWKAQRTLEYDFIELSINQQALQAKTPQQDPESDPVRREETDCPSNASVSDAIIPPLGHWTLDTTAASEVWCGRREWKAVGEVGGDVL